jgi:hypothetical protein
VRVFFSRDGGAREDFEIMDAWVLLIILGRNQRMNEQTATITQFLQGNGCPSSSSPAVAVRRSKAMLWKLVADIVFSFTLSQRFSSMESPSNPVSSQKIRHGLRFAEENLHNDTGESAPKRTRRRRRRTRSRKNTVVPVGDDATRR